MLNKRKIFASLVISALLPVFNIVYAADDTDVYEMTLENRTYENQQNNSTAGLTVQIDDTQWEYNAETGYITNTDGSESFYLPLLIMDNPDGIIKHPTTGAVIGSVQGIGRGGALDLSEYKSINVVGSKFINNQVNLSGDNLTSEESATYTGFGGALNANGKLNVENSEFTGNKVSVKYTETSDYTDENNARNQYVSQGESGAGGAIHNVGDLTVNNSKFTGNSAAYGGAIDNTGTAVIKNSEFSNNISNSLVSGKTTYTYNGEEYTKDSTWYNGNGGAISNTGDLLVENSTFSGNLAAEVGGAIDSNSGNVTIKNSNFINNTAKSESDEGYYRLNEQGEVEYVDMSYVDGYGGAIAVDGYGQDKLTVEDSLFEGNASGSDGGGAIATFINTEVNNSIFRNNSSDYAGGAIQAYGDETTGIVINNSTFENNSSFGDDGTGAGGALSLGINAYEPYGEDVLTNNVTINNTIFKNNSAGDGDDGGGGAVWLYNENGNQTQTITNSKFISNSTTGDGGAIIYMAGTGGSKLNIENTDFEGNTAQSGGGIYHDSGNLNLTDSSFINNTAKSGGGIYVDQGNLTVKNSTFRGNSVKTDELSKPTVNVKGGGAIAMLASNNETVTGGEEPQPPAISNTAGLIIEDSTFIDNSADASDGGGALAIGMTNWNINNSTFKNNSTTFNGGAVSTLYSTSIAANNISNSLFENNTAEKSGGALNIGDWSVNIVDTDFKNNSAAQGGAISSPFIDDFGNIDELFNESFGYNTGINIIARNKDVTFSGNRAEKGGDIYISNRTLRLNANEGRQISFDGGIVGKNSIININDSSINSLYENLSSVGKIVIDNFVSPDENSALAVNLKAGTLALTKDNYLDGTDLTLEEASLLDLANNNVGEMKLNSLTSNNANLKIDMNLASSDNVLDTIKAATATGTLNLQNVNLISDFTDTTTNEYTVSLSDVASGLDIKTPENGLNLLTNDYVYTVKAEDSNFSVNRLADENGEALKTDGFTVAVNQTDKVGGVDVALSDDRVYSANNDIKITGQNSSKGWTGELGGTSLTVNGNGYSLDGENNTGLLVSDGQTLTFNDTNIKGFAPTPERQGALTVNDGGTVNINASNNDISLGNNSDTDVIYLDGTSSKASLHTQNGKAIIVNDKISSANSANELSLNGDGNISFNNKVQQLTLTNENTNTVHNTYIDGVNYNLNNGTVSFSKDEYLNGQGNKNTLNFNGGTLNIANNSVGTIDLAAININSNSNIMLDADLAQENMDRITADSATAAQGAILNVSEINLLSDATKDTVTINAVDPAITLDANDTLASHIATSITEVAYSPIYKYGVGYDATTGNFTFSRGSSESYNNLNPSVMVGPVAAQLGGYMGMLDTYNNAFNNMDMRMLLPSSVRITQRQANRYAITDTAGTEYNYNETNSGGTWVRPFAAYDSVGLKNGPKVDNFSYGTFIGGDTSIHQFKNGGEGVLSAHLSYLGSHQNFAGNSIYQNGGNLGVTGTFYKGNFFSGLTVNAGASVADASTRYGNEDFPMFMTGVANKTGYNFEFKDGKFIIQPSLLLSYTFVNTFDYTNAAGVSINGDPLHAFQISPNLRFALNTKNGWQPYLTVGMNWNIMNDSQFTANMATLPDLSLKPYVQYGLGIQKVINDNFTAYGQVLIRNGGRNGIAANAGMRYLFGHETKTDEEAEEI